LYIEGVQDKLEEAAKKEYEFIAAIEQLKQQNKALEQKVAELAQNLNLKLQQNQKLMQDFQLSEDKCRLEKEKSKFLQQ
jgi:hypothetical protein